MSTPLLALVRSAVSEVAARSVPRRAHCSVRTGSSVDEVLVWIQREARAIIVIYFLSLFVFKNFR